MSEQITDLAHAATGLYNERVQGEIEAGNGELYNNPQARQIYFHALRDIINVLNTFAEDKVPKRITAAVLQSMWDETTPSNTH